MKANSKFYYFLLLLAIGCTSSNTKDEINFAKHIRFNHLYIVIDDSTYNSLFDCIQILDDFSENIEQTVTAENRAWSGKYLFGSNQYLEIFKPVGDKQGRFGELGLGFLTDKSGTLNSVRNEWKRKKEKGSFSNRKIVRDGKSFPLFQMASIEQSNDLSVFSWLMEYEEEEMISVGFTQEDLKQVISWPEYAAHRKAADLNLMPDEIKFEKTFDKITQLHITLTQNELESLKKSLRYFGFTEEGNCLISQDISIKYKISLHKGFVLNQIDFELSSSMEQGTFRCNNLEFIVTENKAHLKFYSAKPI